MKLLLQRNILKGEGLDLFGQVENGREGREGEKLSEEDSLGVVGLL